MNLLLVLLNPEREEREGAEGSVVREAANLLQVGEFQLLALAARQWFGQDLPEPALGQLFSRYLLREEVPPWARHFARGILSRAEGRDCMAPEGAAVAPARGDPRRFWLAASLLVMTLAGAVITAAGAVRHPISRMPPYIEHDEVPPGDAAAPDTSR